MATYNVSHELDNGKNEKAVVKVENMQFDEEENNGKSGDSISVFLSAYDLFLSVHLSIIFYVKLW